MTQQKHIAEWVLLSRFFHMFRSFVFSVFFELSSIFRSLSRQYLVSRALLPGGDSHSPRQTNQRTGLPGSVPLLWGCAEGYSRSGPAVGVSSAQKLNTWVVANLNSQEKEEILFWTYILKFSPLLYISLFFFTQSSGYRKTESDATKEES